MSVTESENGAYISCWIKPCHPLIETQKGSVVIMPSIGEGGSDTPGHLPSPTTCG